jgi:hypothetical protein
VEGQGSILNLSFRTALDVEKQENQALKIKLSKISYLKILSKSSEFEV